VLLITPFIGFHLDEHFFSDNVFHLVGWLLISFILRRPYPEANIACRSRGALFF
jgi:hypothetical protein